MSKQISFTLPVDEPAVLEEMGEMLKRLAFRTARGLSDDDAALVRGEATTEQFVNHIVDTVAATTGVPADALRATIPEIAAPTTEQQYLGNVPAPLPPNVAIATSDPNAVPMAHGNAPDLDSEGLPWDKRIHSSSRKQNADGTWRIAKNMDKALIEQVKAELRGVMAAPVPAVDTATVFAPAPVATLILPVDTPTITADPMPFIPAPVVTPAPPANSAGPTTFPEFVQYVTRKSIPRGDVNVVCAKHGVTDLPLLAARPDIIPAVYAELVMTWGA